jgi:hypothetical protein
MRTRESTITFRRPFRLNGDVGELPPGNYDIEIDEEEIQATGRTAYHRVAIYFYVRTPASTRTIVVTPADLESALERDLIPGSEQADADQDVRHRLVGKVL